MVRATSGIQAHCERCEKLQPCRHIGYPPETRLRRYDHLKLTVYIRERECLICGLMFETAELAESMIAVLESEFFIMRDNFRKKLDEELMKKSADATILGWKQDIAFEIDALTRMMEKFLELAEKVETFSIKGELFLEISGLEKRIVKLKELQHKIETAMRNTKFFKGWK